MINQQFLEILNIQSVSYNTDSMVEYILDRCLERGYDVELHEGNLYVTKGVSTDGKYPCIVSHTDTVHDIIPTQDYMVVHDDNIAMAYDIKNMRPTGVGGDDKVGIYICLSMLESLDYCKAAFFRDEEVGCVGSGVADLSFFNDCRFILQCDRKGNSDFVYNIFGTDLYGEEFYNDISPIIANYGYHESTGGLTDVYTLAQSGVGICVANMSCGYYNPHMDDEMINLSDVENCLNMVYSIMSSCTKVYEFKFTPKTYAKPLPTVSKGNWYGGWDSVKKEDTAYNDWDGWSYDGKTYSKSYSTEKTKDCWHCGIEYYSHELKDGMCEYCIAYHKDDKTYIPF
jgi:hypothetical protein